VPTRAPLQLPPVLLHAPVELAHPVALHVGVHVQVALPIAAERLIRDITSKGIFS
jgi:hypothetical protein